MRRNAGNYGKGRRRLFFGIQTNGKMRKEDESDEIQKNHFVCTGSGYDADLGSLRLRQQGRTGRDHP